VSPTAKRGARGARGRAARPVTRIAIDVAAEGVRLPLSQARVRDAAALVLRAAKVRDAMLSFAFVDARRMARLNREHLGHAGATDVISFGFARPTPDAPVVGDVYVCPDVARENARAAGCGVREELLRLVVHGTLHVLGHEHPVDDDRTSSRMWRTQERLLKRALAAADDSR
jgi:probable rRNA maturation factor